MMISDLTDERSCSRLTIYRFRVTSPIAVKEHALLFGYFFITASAFAATASIKVSSGLDLNRRPSFFLNPKIVWKRYAHFKGIM
jgi:hypothetical protein